MARNPSFNLNRRFLLGGAAAAGASVILPNRLLAAEFVATPGQTEGPFYPVAFPPDRDNDLIQVRGEAAERRSGK